MLFLRRHSGILWLEREDFIKPCSLGENTAYICTLLLSCGEGAFVESGGCAVSACCEIWDAHVYGGVG